MSGADGQVRNERHLGGGRSRGGGAADSICRGKGTERGQVERRGRRPGQQRTQGGQGCTGTPRTVTSTVHSRRHSSRRAERCVLGLALSWCRQPAALRAHRASMCYPSSVNVRRVDPTRVQQFTPRPKSSAFIHCWYMVLPIHLCSAWPAAAHQAACGPDCEWPQHSARKKARSAHEPFVAPVEIRNVRSKDFQCHGSFQSHARPGVVVAEALENADISSGGGGNGVLPTDEFKKVRLGCSPPTTPGRTHIVVTCQGVSRLSATQPIPQVVEWLFPDLTSVDMHTLLTVFDTSGSGSVQYKRFLTYIQTGV